MRDKVFEESEEQLIDIYDVKVHVNYFSISVVSKKKILLYISVIYIKWLLIWTEDKKQKSDLFLETKKIIERNWICYS